MADGDYEPVLNDEILSWVGREGPVVTAEVTQRDIERYAHAVDNHNPLFLDEETARESPFGGLIAPFLFYPIPFIRPLRHDELQEDGLPSEDAELKPPIPLPRDLFGGQEVEYVRPIRPGDVLTRRSRISSIEERRGRSGPLVFVETEMTYHDSGGELVLTVRSTTILL